MRKARLRGEALEKRNLLTGEGVALPVASVHFAEEVELMSPSQGQIGHVIAVDLNADGLDDYAATVTGQSSRVMVFIADGDGYVGQSMPIVAGNYFSAIDVGDVNGDGRPDIVAAGEKVVHSYINLGSSTDSVWLGMQPHEEILIAARSLQLSDLNGDQRADLIMGTDLRIDARIADSQGKFTSGIWYLNTPGLKTVATGDINGDNFIDVIAHAAESSSIVVLQNDGGGFLAESQTIPGVDPVQAMKLLDVNGDSRLDLVVGGQNQYHDNLHIWTGHVLGGFDVNSVGFETVGAPLDFSVGDINDDGFADLVVGHAGTFHHPINDNGPGGISLMLAMGPGQFHEPIRVTTPGAKVVDIVDMEGTATIQSIGQYDNRRTQITWNENPLIQEARDYALPADNMFQFRNTVFGDFNNDGATDAMVANRFDESIDSQLFLANPDGTYTVTPLPLDPIKRVMESFVGDFDGDGVDDLGIQSDVGILALISNGDGTFQAPRQGVFPESFGNYQVIDINHDGRDDLVGTEGIPTTTWVVSALADENGQWHASPSRLELTNRFVSELTFSDLNGDNVLDVVATSFQSVEAALGLGNGSFAASLPIAMENSFQAVGDLNGDGYGDIAGTDFGELNLTIAYGTAGGTFDIVRNVPLDVELANTQGLEAIDADGDGTSELVVSSLDRFFLLSSDGDGGFSAAEYTTRFYPGQFFVQEVTGDDHPDLIVAPGANFIGGTPTTDIAIFPGTAESIFGSSDPASASFNDGQLTVLEKQNDRVEFLVSHRLGFGKMIAPFAAGAPGDFNGDGIINSHDIDLLCAATHDPNLSSADMERFDQNADDLINSQDVETWLAEVANTRHGDADLDGDVDFADFLRLSAAFGETDALWHQGDFDCNGEVGFSDFLMLSSQFGR